MKGLPPVAGVLIGGKSRRMGKPKHLLKRGGDTFLERIVRTLSAVVQDVILVGEGACPDSLQELTRLTDAPGVQGPLAGILSILSVATGRGALVVGCDFPDIDPASCRWLLAFMDSARSVVIPKYPSGEIQPCFSLYLPEMADTIANSIASGTLHAPRQLASCRDALTPVMPPYVAARLVNVNSPGDLLALPPVSNA